MQLPGDLPETLRSLRSRPLFVMRLDVKRLQIVGATPAAFRRIRRGAAVRRRVGGSQRLAERAQ
jgi:hypothetical protein